MPSILRLTSTPDGTGLPLSSRSDQVWSSGKFFCSGGSGFGGASLSSVSGPPAGVSGGGETQGRGGDRHDWK